jgi:predicted porin
MKPHPMHGVAKLTDSASGRIGIAWIKGTLAVVALGLACSAAAQAPGATADQWRFEFTPYFWAAGMKGAIESGSLPRTNIDMSFSDIWDALDFGAMGAFEARKGRFGILFDAIYMKLTEGATTSRTGPGPIGATATAEANLKMEQTVLAAALAYRVTDGPTAVDVLAGARYIKLDATADIAGSFFASSGSVSRSGDKDWTDPYIGVRVLHPLNERWTLTGYLDYGGFGVGSDSTWQAIAGAEYNFSKTVSMKFGYRELSVDYDSGGFLYDMKQKGAYLGVGIRF